MDEATDQSEEELTGGCACGAIRYRMKTAPMFVHCCHCLDCQRQTGSAFVINALIETSRLEVDGADPERFEMPTDSGRPHGIYSCQACGTAVWSEYGGLATLRFVRVGTLDEPQLLVPGVHLYTRSKVPWVTLPDDVPAFEGYYDPTKLWSPDSLQRRSSVLTG